MIEPEMIKSIFRKLSPSDINIGEDATTINIEKCTIKIPNAEIQEYLDLKNKRFERTEFMIHHNGYYEHAMKIKYRGVPLWRPIEEIVLTNDTKGFKVIFGSFSSKFIMNLTDSDTLNNKAIPRIWRFNDPSKQESTTLQDCFRSMVSIKVFSPIENPIGSDSNKMSKIADSAMYNISYVKGISVTRIKSWERQTRPLNEKTKDEPKFPKKTYESDLISQYQEAIGEENLVYGYLGFYKILEYCFSETKEKELHQRIRNVLTGPAFDGAETSHLRKLASTIIKYENKNQEKAQLLMVLREHFTELELNEWITEFNSRNNRHFSSSTQCLDDVCIITHQIQGTYLQITERIYQIRNAIVHNKEEKHIRYVPQSGFDRLLHNDIKLVKHIAEGLIVRTGKDLIL